MISVFSNYLEPLQEACLICLTDDSKPSEIYDQLRIAYNQGSIGVANTTRLIAPITDDEDNYDIIEEVWRNKELQSWLQWVNQKITLCIGVESYQTLGVRLRIATTKLDKIDLPFQIGAKIHYYLCNNTWNEHRLVVNENLPFQGCPLEVVFNDNSPLYSTVCSRSDTLITG